MTRTAALLCFTLALAVGCAGDDDDDNLDPTCGALPDGCGCTADACQYEGCYSPCYCDSDTGAWIATHCDPAPPDAGPDAQACPNAIASDENCAACMKDHGAGASYCAADCVTDNDCVGMSSGWGSVALRCHPNGYCTATCTTSADCILGDGVDYACDDGRCSACLGCF